MNGLRLPQLNAVHISGRLTRDPELRYTQAGVPVLNGRLASNTFFRSADGEWQQDTTYVSFVAWQGLAERCYERLSRGSAVLVTGRLVSSEWESEKGEKRSSVEIRADRVQFLERTEAGDEPESGVGEDASEEGAERR